jgi:hypothetical protein
MDGCVKLLHVNRGKGLGLWTGVLNCYMETGVKGWVYGRVF